MSDLAKYEKLWRNLKPDNALNIILASTKYNNPHEAIPNKVMISAIDKQHREKILDFGAGVGRNTYGLIDICNDVWAFDFPNMIDMLESNPIFLDSCITTSSNWNEVRKDKFSAIFSIVVLQHIHKEVVRSYLKDFTYMTDNLYIQSRSYSDYERISMYDLITEHWEIDDTFPFSKDKTCSLAKEQDHYFIRLHPRRLV